MNRGQQRLAGARQIVDLFLEEPLAFDQFVAISASALRLTFCRRASSSRSSRQFRGHVAVFAGIAGFDVGAFLGGRRILRELRGEHAEFGVDLGQAHARRPHRPARLRARRRAPAAVAFEPLASGRASFALARAPRRRRHRPRRRAAARFRARRLRLGDLLASARSSSAPICVARVAPRARYRHRAARRAPCAASRSGPERGDGFALARDLAPPRRVPHLARARSSPRASPSAASRRSRSAQPAAGSAAGRSQHAQTQARLAASARRARRHGSSAAAASLSKRVCSALPVR